VIPSENSTLIILPNKTYDLEILEETYMAYQVICKDQLSPAKFTVTYNKSMIKGKHNDLKIYHSSHYREPNEKHHSKMFGAPDKFYISSSSKEGFQDEPLFLSFHSFYGSSIQISVSFPDQTKVSKKDFYKEKMEKDLAERQRENEELTAKLVTKWDKN